MATLTVGTGTGFEYNTLASAIAASQDGDVIEVQAGTYTNDFATITTSITIEGVGGMVNLVATEAPPNLMGILTIGTPGGTGPDVTIDNVSFSGAAIPDDAGGNGAGIRYQSGNLTLNNTYFYDNQDGLLADADPTGTITINNSEFADNGNANPPASGVEHNLYVGAIQQLTIDNSYFTDPIVGHDIKSRAANTTIENSTIVDPNGTGSYEIDLPNGGNAVIENDVIEKAPGSQDNPYFIAYGEEGNLYAGSTLTVTGNTLINDFGSGASLMLNDAGVTPTFTGNTAYGFTASQLPTGSDNTLQPQSSEPALDTAAPYLPVIPFSFACFAAGTRIRTPEGDIPVEALQAGQQVVVVRPNEACATRTIRWIGYRTIDLTRHPEPALAQPIRIRTDAFSDGVPARDLLVSPDHALFAGGLLIQARLLRNGATIVREDRRPAVRYFHVELDQHDILLAEGLPAESYLDTGNRGTFENAGVPLTLHPDMADDRARARRGALSCAPYAVDAARVEPVWRQLAARASDLGFVVAKPASTAEPDLHLLVDGRVCRPVAIAADCHVFILPLSATAVRLISHASAPCDRVPWNEDRRRLGMAVERIVYVEAADVVEIPVDHPSLVDGWWAVERHDGKLWRWTDGNAALPCPPGARVLRLHLAGRTTGQRGAGDGAASAGALAAA